MRVEQELHATNAHTFKEAIYELTGIKPNDYMVQTEQKDYFQQKNFIHISKVYEIDTLVFWFSDWF